MKILKTVVVCLVIAQLLYQYISNIPYYTTVLTRSYLNESVIEEWIQTGLQILLDMLTVIWGLLFLFSPSLSTKDRSYALLRFVYVVSAFFLIPQIPFFIVMSSSYGPFLPNTKDMVIFIAQQVTWVFCTIVLLVGKPKRPVQKIDLTNYELVNYTSTSHRCLHYLLDVLFLLPIVMFWINYFPGLRHSLLNMELLFAIAYFLYCFIAEAVFRQTLGKMATGSCLVSNGGQLSTGRVFLRTLSRLIPFDKLSFLFGGNWHDRVSHTTVVYIDSWENVFENAPAGQPDKN